MEVEMVQCKRSSILVELEKQVVHIIEREMVRKTPIIKMIIHQFKYYRDQIVDVNVPNSIVYTNKIQKRLFFLLSKA